MCGLLRMIQCEGGIQGVAESEENLRLRPGVSGRGGSSLSRGLGAGADVCRAIRGESTEATGQVAGRLGDGYL